MSAAGDGSPGARRGDDVEDPISGSSCKSNNSRDHMPDSPDWSSFSGSNRANTVASSGSSDEHVTDNASHYAPPLSPGLSHRSRCGRLRRIVCAGAHARACCSCVGWSMPSGSMLLIACWTMGWLGPEVMFFAGALIPATLAWFILSGRKTRGPGVLARAIRSLVIVAITMLSLLWPWVGHGGVAACDAAFEHKLAVWGVSQERLGDDVQSTTNHIKIKAVATIVVMLLAVVYLLTDHEPSNFTWKAVWSIGFLWLVVTGGTLEHMLVWCDREVESFPSMQYMWGFGTAGACCSMIIMVFLVWQRLEAFEEALQLRVGSAVIVHMLRLMGILMATTFLSLALFGWGQPFAVCFAGSVAAGIASFTAGTIYISALMCRPLRALWAEARISKGVARRQTMWAANVLLGELIAIYITLASSGLHSLMMAICELKYESTLDKLRHGDGWSIWVCRISDALCNILGLLILSGLWQWRTPPSLAHFAGRVQRRLERKASSGTQAQNTLTRSVSLSAAFPADERQAWLAKVDELAHRGMRLESLLDFYARDLLGLGGGLRCMPSFQPTMSTTRDVVREAVIPLSGFSDGSGGVALATKWNQGERIRAEKMVTHVWSSTFTDLVAAVVADALGRDRYIEELDLLVAGRIEELKVQLRAARTLQQVYWVCCFSINQHAGICGGYGSAPQDPGPRYDVWAESRLNTVSKELYPLCSCSEPKYFNDAPLQCELNKFDDMMALLSLGDRFGHVVAMDRTFELLTRVWCLAEIAEAEASRIPQKVLIYDDWCIDAEYHKLKHLDIRECEATRQEDKDHILANIPDIDVFCETLQELVMGDGGLLSKFTNREAKLRSAAKFMRRAIGI